MAKADSNLIAKIKQQLGFEEYTLLFVLLNIALFLIAYVDSVGYAISSIVVALIAVIYYKFIPKNRFLPASLLAMMLFFGIVSFYRLGSDIAPKTFGLVATVTPKAQFVFDRKRPIDRVCFYTNIDFSSKYRFRYNDNGVMKDYFKDKTSDFPYSFQWHCQKKNVVTDRFEFGVYHRKVQISEVRFYYRNRSIAFKTNNKFFNDERDIEPDTTYMHRSIFDEVYHPRTAYEFTRNIWPIYETTHPFLGKQIIAIGIRIWGMNPFGWRFTNVLFAIALIGLFYHLAKLLFSCHRSATFAAFLMTYSMLHLAQSRFSGIDTYGVFFTLLAFCFLLQFIKKQTLFYLLATGVAYGLATAVKWSAVFAIASFGVVGLFILWQGYELKAQYASWRLPLYGFFGIFVLALVVHIATYYPMWKQYGYFGVIWDYNVQAYNYHHGLKAEHAYSSPWWSWPLDLKPICYYRDYESKLGSYITASGNFVVYWFGILAIFYTLYRAIKHKLLEAVVIVSGFAVLYLPYAFIDRIMFFYHYYYAVPFMFLAVVFTWKDIIEKFASRGRVAFFVFFALTALVFFLYLPTATGFYVPKGYVESLQLLPKWWF